MEYDDFHEEVNSFASNSDGSVLANSSSIPEQFKQEELSDPIRDLNLFKQAAEILAYRLKDKNCLRTRASITFYHTREKELLPNLEKKKNLFTVKTSKGFY